MQTRCTDFRKAYIIMNFISNCKEEINYKFIIPLKSKFLLSGLEPKDLEEVFKKICTSVPFEHADKFSLIYYCMLTSYFDLTKDYEMNRQFIIKWILSRHSFILMGFKHQGDVTDAEAAYYPRAEDIYTAFADSLHDPRLINNIIDQNALEFTFKGLCHYPESKEAYEKLVTHLMEEYYIKLREENSSDYYHGIFVARHGADPQHFSYPIYKKILTKTGRDLKSSAFNFTDIDTKPVSLPAFIHDAILKMLFTMAPVRYCNVVEKITQYAIKYSNIYNIDKKYADFLRETYNVNQIARISARAHIVECIEKEDYPNAIYIFKNIIGSSSLRDSIDLFKNRGKMPELIEGIKPFEFVNCENERIIYNLVKENGSSEDVEALLLRMSKQSCCFFDVPSEEINYIIRKQIKNVNSCAEIGSLAFVCKDKELLESFKDDVDDILTNWDFAQNLEKFYNGVASVEGRASVKDLPFFTMCYTELFLWLDKNISIYDKAQKISRMLMVAMLAVKGPNSRMEAASIEDTSITPTYALEKGIFRAVSKTRFGYEAVCAFQFYMGESFRKYLDEEVLPNIIAIEGADSVELLQAREFRCYYRKLLNLKEGLTIDYGSGSCSIEKMQKFIYMTEALIQIEILGALKAIKKKSEIKGEFTDIKYYTENIPIISRDIYRMIASSL
ncbi:hypothetical protein ENBRE01_1559 [Enteropsectra breve]|nr:hypothetical protein ENBRE01_1559 [Enteropsectra breve]